MFESSPRHRVACALALAVVLLLMLVPVAVVLAQAPTQTWQVVGHRCDDRGGVTALAIDVIAPGPIVLRWDNAVICGKPV